MWRVRDGGKRLFLGPELGITSEILALPFLPWTHTHTHTPELELVTRVVIQNLRFRDLILQHLDSFFFSFIYSSAKREDGFDIIRYLFCPEMRKILYFLEKKKKKKKKNFIIVLKTKFFFF